MPPRRRPHDSLGTAQQTNSSGTAPQAARPPAAASADTNKHVLAAASAGFGNIAAEELAYIAKLQIADVRASETGPKVLGAIKNAGDRTLEDVVIIVDCLNCNGTLIFEKESHSGVSKDYPLEPGRWGKFTVPALDQRGIAPPNWSSGQLKARVARVKLE